VNEEKNNISVSEGDGVVASQDEPVLEAGTEQAPPEIAAADPVAVLTDERDQLRTERDQLLAEKAELTDRLLRRAAEFENHRKRTERERADFLQYAGMEVVREILPVVDDFERALKHETADAEYRKGIDLIYQRLLDTLKRMGLEPIESQGKPFDPNMHQAVQRVETAEAEDQQVLEEFQRGYNFKGKLLRPAMVKVAVKPPETA
jgi:molecular chaperone GrpE